MCAREEWRIPYRHCQVESTAPSDFRTLPPAARAQRQSASRATAVHLKNTSCKQSEHTLTLERLAESKSARTVSFPTVHTCAASSGSGCGHTGGARGRSSDTVRGGGHSLRGPRPVATEPTAEPALVPVGFALPPVPPAQSGRPTLALGRFSTCIRARSHMPWKACRLSVRTHASATAYEMA
jgi:hypothetical protein